MTERKEPLSGTTRDTTAEDLLRQVRESKADKEEIKRKLARLGFILTSNQELIDLKPFVDSENENGKTPDVIEEKDGRLVGKVYFYQLQGDSLELVERTFNVPIQSHLPVF